MLPSGSNHPPNSYAPNRNPYSQLVTAQSQYHATGSQHPPRPYTFQQSHSSQQASQLYSNTYHQHPATSLPPYPTSSQQYASPSSQQYFPASQSYPPAFSQQYPPASQSYPSTSSQYPPASHPPSTSSQRYAPTFPAPPQLNPSTSYQPFASTTSYSAATSSSQPVATSSHVPQPTPVAASNDAAKLPACPPLVLPDPCSPQRLRQMRDDAISYSKLNKNLSPEEKRKIANFLRLCSEVWEYWKQLYESQMGHAGASNFAPPSAGRNGRDSAAGMAGTPGAAVSNSVASLSQGRKGKRKANDTDSAEQNGKKREKAVAGESQQAGQASSPEKRGSKRKTEVEATAPTPKKARVGPGVADGTSADSAICIDDDEPAQQHPRVTAVQAAPSGMMMPPWAAQGSQNGRLQMPVASTPITHPFMTRFFAPQHAQRRQGWARGDKLPWRTSSSPVNARRPSTVSPQKQLAPSIMLRPQSTPAFIPWAVPAIAPSPATSAAAAASPQRKRKAAGTNTPRPVDLPHVSAIAEQSVFVQPQVPLRVHDSSAVSPSKVTAGSSSVGQRKQKINAGAAPPAPISADRPPVLPAIEVPSVFVQSHALLHETNTTAPLSSEASSGPSAAQEKLRGGATSPTVSISAAPPVVASQSLQRSSLPQGSLRGNTVPSSVAAPASKDVPESSSVGKRPQNASAIPPPAVVSAATPPAVSAVAKKNQESTQKNDSPAVIYTLKVPQETGEVKEVPIHLSHAPLVERKPLREDVPSSSVAVLPKKVSGESSSASQRKQKAADVSLPAPDAATCPPHNTLPKPAQQLPSLQEDTAGSSAEFSNFDFLFPPGLEGFRESFEELESLFVLN